MSEVSARQAEYSAHDDQIQELDNQIAELGQRLSSAVDAHSNDGQALDDKVHQKKRANAELSEKLAGTEFELQATREALRAQETFTKAGRARRVGEVSALKQHVNDGIQLCTNLQEEIAELEKRLVAATATHDNDADALQEKLVSEKAQVVALTQSLSAVQQALLAVQSSAGCPGAAD